MFITYVVAAVLVVIFSYLRTSENGENQKILQSWSVFALIVIIRWIRVAMDIFVFLLFIKILQFYVKFKRSMLKNLGLEFNRKQNFVIYWALSVAFMNLYRSIFFCINSIFIYYPDVNAEGLNYFNRSQVYRTIAQMQRYLIQSLIDFFTGISLLYLYYDQAKT